jgi:hypothetical protein
MPKTATPVLDPEEKTEEEEDEEEDESEGFDPSPDDW